MRCEVEVINPPSPRIRILQILENLKCSPFFFLVKIFWKSLPPFKIDATCLSLPPPPWIRAWNLIMLKTKMFRIEPGPHHYLIYILKKKKTNVTEDIPSIF